MPTGKRRRRSFFLILNQRCNGDRITPPSRHNAVCSRSGGYWCAADFGFGYALLLGFTFVSSTGTVDCSRVELLTSAP
jgi:hypothetical protein